MKPAPIWARQCLERQDRWHSVRWQTPKRRAQTTRRISNVRPFRAAVLPRIASSGVAAHHRAPLSAGTTESARGMAPETLGISRTLVTILHRGEKSRLAIRRDVGMFMRRSAKRDGRICGAICASASCLLNPSCGINEHKRSSPRSNSIGGNDRETPDLARFGAYWARVSSHRFRPLYRSCSCHFHAVDRISARLPVKAGPDPSMFEIGSVPHFQE